MTINRRSNQPLWMLAAVGLLLLSGCESGCGSPCDPCRPSWTPATCEPPSPGPTPPGPTPRGPFISRVVVINQTTTWRIEGENPTPPPPPSTIFLLPAPYRLPQDVEPGQTYPFPLPSPTADLRAIVFVTKLPQGPTYRYECQCPYAQSDTAVIIARDNGENPPIVLCNGQPCAGPFPVP